jgi:hypothetical protein
MVIPARAGTSVRPRPLPAEAFTDEATYLQTRLPVDLAATLIPDAYTSGEFFGLERERVFASSWVAIGTTDQVEQTGQVILAEVAGRPPARMASQSTARL